LIVLIETLVCSEVHLTSYTYDDLSRRKLITLGNGIWKQPGSFNITPPPLTIGRRRLVATFNIAKYTTKTRASALKYSHFQLSTEFWQIMNPQVNVYQTEPVSAQQRYRF
jgi:hypothetical protein